jgi:hypothetical protein
VSFSPTEPSDHYYSEIPGYLKIIILAQAATILSLTIAMYQVYLNDTYFQQYVISLFQTNIIADATLSIVTASVFALGTFTLLGSMTSSRRVNKEWRLLSEAAKSPHMPSIPVLEVVERPSKSQIRRPRPRNRKPRVDTGTLYDSMRYFADDQKEQ